MRSFLIQKRLTALCGVTLVVAGLVAGCGGGSSSLDPGTGTSNGDKNTIVFAGTNGIYSIQSDGTKQRRLTSGNSDSSPSRSQKAGRIAFESYRDDTDGVLTNREIYSCDFSGRNLLRLTEDDVTGVDKRGVQDFQPEISPDGKSIAWISARGRTTNPPQGDNIWLMDITGKNQRRLTSEISVSNFTWGRDSKSILFSSAQTAGQNGAFSLKRIDIAAGTSETLSTAGDFSDMQLSPDGTRLVFNLTVNGATSPGLRFYDIASGAITNGPTVSGNSNNASWSPDSQSLVFEAGGRLYIATPTADAIARAITASGFDVPSWNE